MVLKRRTTQNIVWGGLAGCFPALIGWTAVTGELPWVPVVLFAVVFFWTPPHTWALALRYREDYAQRRRADAAGGRAGARRRPPDRALQLGDGRDVAAAVAGGRHRAVLPRRRGRAGCGVPGRGAPDVAPHPRHRGPARDPADAAVPLLEPLPLPALRRRRARPAARSADAICRRAADNSAVGPVAVAQATSSKTVPNRGNQSSGCRVYLCDERSACPRGCRPARSTPTSARAPSGSGLADPDQHPGDARRRSGPRRACGSRPARSAGR